MVRRGPRAEVDNVEGVVRLKPRAALGLSARPAPPVGEDLAGGVLAGLAGDAAAGVGAGAGEVEPVDRHPVAGEAEEWPPDEQAVEGRLGVEQMAAGQAIVALEIERA